MNLNIYRNRQEQILDCYMIITWWRLQFNCLNFAKYKNFIHLEYAEIRLKGLII
jgi:hypothetical protein